MCLFCRHKICHETPCLSLSSLVVVVVHYLHTSCTSFTPARAGLGPRVLRSGIDFLHGPSMPITPKTPLATDANSDRPLRRKCRSAIACRSGRQHGLNAAPPIFAWHNSCTEPTYGILPHSHFSFLFTYLPIKIAHGGNVAKLQS